MDDHSKENKNPGQSNVSFVVQTKQQKIYTMFFLASFLAKINMTCSPLLLRRGNVHAVVKITKPFFRMGEGDLLILLRRKGRGNGQKLV